jgi:hypothetical protein
VYSQTEKSATADQSPKPLQDIATATIPLTEHTDMEQVSEEAGNDRG